MVWQANSKFLILKHRAYEINSQRLTSTNLSDLLDQQMAYLLDKLPDMVAIVETDLATLETLDTSLTTEQGSTNASLIRADVLEWSAGQKTSGIEKRYETVRSRIARTLSQSFGDGAIGGGSWGLGMLGRS